jgi:hypothetical protein
MHEDDRNKCAPLRDIIQNCIIILIPYLGSKCFCEYRLVVDPFGAFDKPSYIGLITLHHVTSVVFISRVWIIRKWDRPVYQLPVLLILNQVGIVVVARNFTSESDLTRFYICK